MSHLRFNTKAGTICRLSFINILSRPYRSALLFLITFLTGCFLFAGGCLVLSFSNGIEQLTDRFGADIIVVPLESDTDMESILLEGTPGYFYMDSSTLDVIDQIDGISQYSYQVYLTSTGSDCCEMEIQLIGFDPGTDFTITPWISETYSGNLLEGDLVVGSNITVKNGKSLTFFGKEYTVASKLAETGTGLDNAVFTTVDTLQDLMDASIEKGFSFLDGTDITTSISSILINVDDSADMDEVATSIRQALDHVTVITSESFISSLSDQMISFADIFILFIFVYLVLAFLMLMLVFGITVNERKKEFAIYRLSGMTKKQLSLMLLGESFLISLIGGLTGSISSLVLLQAFDSALKNYFIIPYEQPEANIKALLFFVSILICIISAPLSASLSTYRTAKASVSNLLRKDN